MGHFLNAFLGHPGVLAGMAPAIRGLRLTPLPQGLALAPLPSALGNAAILDHGPLEGWRELDHDNTPFGQGRLCVELSAIAAAASRAGPVGWLKSEWFGGHGPGNTVALWRDGQASAVGEGDADSMLAALGVRPAAGDRWDALDLHAHRDTWRAWSSAVPVQAPGPTPAQRALLAELHLRLGPYALAPLQDRTPEPVSRDVLDAYLFESAFVPLQLGGRAVWAFTHRQGGGLGALLPVDPSDHDDFETPNLTLAPEQEAHLRAKGWRLRQGEFWEAVWSDVEPAVEGLLAVDALG